MQNRHKVRSLEQAINNKTKFFLPEDIEVPFPKKKSYPDLLVAAILSSELYQDLIPECDILLLSEDDAQEILQFAKPDFMLIESVWETPTGDWNFWMCEHSSKWQELATLLTVAKKNHIPSVFWITQDVNYLHHFVSLLHQFDFIYCCDPRAIEMLEQKGIRAKLLLPAIQPNLFHPYKTYDTRIQRKKSEILYDGWIDLIQGKKSNQLLESIDLTQFKIIQTKIRMSETMVERTHPMFKSNIGGYAPREALPTLLRQNTLYLSSNETQRSKTSQIRNCLEAAACYNTIVHHGNLSFDDLRNEIIEPIADMDELLIELERLKEPLYQQSKAHISWRGVFKEHTIAHRLKTIIKDLGLSQEWEEYPKATLITPTLRPEHFQRVLSQYEAQSYPNKELVIVFNGHYEIIKDLKETIAERPDIRVTSVFQDYYAGACLNVGAHIATGSYVFRFDDDDFYGPNYLLDIMLSFRAIAANVTGKEFQLFTTNEGPEVYKRMRKNHAHFVFKASDLSYAKIGLAGCTLGGEKQLFLENPYPTDNAYAVDAEFSFGINKSEQDLICLSLDNMNLVVYRNVDKTQHTWQIDVDTFKLNSVVLSHDITDLMI